MSRRPTRAKGNPKGAAPRKAQPPADSRVRELETRLAEAAEQLQARDRELAEAQEQLTAASEILRVISSSPTDYQPVFDTIVRRAGVVCGAVDAILWTREGDELVVRAHHGPIPATIGARQPTQGSVAGAAAREARVVHVEDLTQSDDFPVGRALARRVGWRTTLSAPLLRGGVAIGALLVRRSEVRPFTDRQIALLQTFAAEAVIALENVRLFTETNESLERQTATAEVLRVISSSPTDVQPVFDAIVRSASVLCHAPDVIITISDGAALRVAGSVGPVAASVQQSELFQGGRLPLTRGSVTGRAFIDRRTVHVQDVSAMSDEFPEGRQLQREYGGRGTTLAVPLLREGESVGVITLVRNEITSFTERQIALLEIFADQAVIAIENVRLFTELQTSNGELTAALEQQTATSEILRAITHAPTDTQPVFDAIVRSAAALCHAAVAAVFLTDGQQVFAPANYGSSPEALETVLARFPRPLDMESSGGAAILTKAVVHVPDIEESSGGEWLRQNLRRLGVRSLITVPMLRDGAAMGAVGVYRREPGRFSTAEVALLQTFADQAVIAIENVRLFKELESRNRELVAALDQQTATAEILRVISRSVTDVQPVFDAIVRSAVRLCGASHGGVYRFDGEMIHSVAHEGFSPEQLEQWRKTWPRPVGESSSPATVAIRTREILRIGDIEATAVVELAPEARANLRARGSRSVLVVPMISHDAVLGVIGLVHPGVDAFSDAHVELLRTFADQAVIAVENVRLFNETKEALDRQTATAEILRVIAGSPTDLQPVLDAVAESAARVCGAEDAVVMRVEGDMVHPVSYSGALPPSPTFRGGRRLSPRYIVGRAILDRRTVHVGNLAEAMDEYPEAVPEFRTVLAAPLVREGAAVGAIVMRRREVRPFTDKQVALLQTFADQAVIAIENVRLFKELDASNKHLTDALDKQTATSDILRAISQSQTDVQPVFEAILSSALRLMGAQAGALTRLRGDHLDLAALKGADQWVGGGAATLRQLFPVPLHGDGAHASAIRTRMPVNIGEAQNESRESVRSIAQAVGYQSLIVVPMLHHETAIGAITAVRREPGGFSGDEVALVQTFADQAVIAIENARLLGELQTRTGELSRSVEQLTALGEVGRAVSSTLDLETVLTTIVTRAVELSGLDGGVVFEYDEKTEEFVHRVATAVGGALAEARRTTRIRKGEGAVGRTALTLEPAQVPDITVPGAYESRLRDNLIASGIRAVLAVPMVREGELIGCLVVSRNRTGEFTADTIELMRTFATQSALAIQNARLFREIEIKSRELEAASRHKSEFLANMSHELRTPLNAIIGFSEVLSERMFGELNAKQDEYLKDIHASGQHLLSLINDILDLSKIEAGKMELELSDFDLPSTVDNALMLVRERAGRRGIELHKAVDAQLGLIEADERKVRQVLLNLLSNAIKFTPEGGRIDVGAVPRDGMVEVSVTDTGVGIALEDQEAVFEEFRQVGAADKRAGGTGLGLALSRKFIELHGGRIWVKSQVGAGSTFTFAVPAQRGG